MPQKIPVEEFKILKCNITKISGNFERENIHLDVKCTDHFVKEEKKKQSPSLGYLIPPFSYPNTGIPVLAQCAARIFSGR